jgi:hypothetical protein
MKKYTIHKRIRKRKHFWRELLHSVLKWLSRRVFGEKIFLHNIEDDSYEKVLVGFFAQECPPIASCILSLRGLY